MIVAGPLDLGSPRLHAHVRDRILHVRLDNPARRNATTQDMYRGIKRAAIVADREPDIAALCLTGTGEWFGVGGDMSGTGAGSDDLGVEWDHTDHFPFRHLEQCRAVVVSKVNGHCHAGGLNLVLYGDISVASDRARFRVPELLRGAPDPWMAARLPSHVGLAAAKYLLFTGEEIDASTALQMGLVSKVVPHESLDGEVDRVLDQVVRMAPNATSQVKDDLNRRLAPADQNMFRRAMESAELAEGLNAFLERRDPNWPR